MGGRREGLKLEFGGETLIRNMATKEIDAGEPRESVWVLM